MARRFGFLCAASILALTACAGNHIGAMPGYVDSLSSSDAVPVTVHRGSGPARYSITYIPLAAGCGLVEPPQLASNGDVAVDEICGGFTDVLVYHGGSSTHLASHFLYSDGINSNGKVVVQGERAHDGIVDVFSGKTVWLTGKYPLARGINDSGYVVGDASTCQTNYHCSHAARFAPDGTPTLLTVAYTNGIAINAKGTVLGKGWDPQGNYRSFLYEANGRS